MADELTAMPAAKIAKPLRAQRQLRFGQRPSEAWNRFVLAAGAKWHAAWDQATGVPSRMWGPGISVPGANASPKIAEQAARRWLADQIGLLSPGATVADFELVANHSDGEIRSVGFQQRANGLRVVGGQVSFRFKRDRLFMIGSEALPNVVVMTPHAKVARWEARATTELRTALALPHAPVRGKGADVVVPFVGDDAVLGYRVATPMEIDGGAEGRYLAYLDASGAVLAVRQQNFYATGTLRYRGVDRHPARTRIDRPAPNTNVTLAGAPATTTIDGKLDWTSNVPEPVVTNVVGSYVSIVNKASDTLASTSLTIAPSGVALWDPSADALVDAQVQTYLSANTVKRYVREKIDPAMPHLDEVITANVNIDNSCNAFFDGDAINFFQSSSQCQNTGLLEDVVFHEFGHALHTAEIIPGVGSFDGAMSEGASDFLATLLTKDPGMGRGFFYTDEALRHLDPVGSENVWPKDIGEIHYTGLIFGQTFFDLHKALVARRGAVLGERIVDKLFLAALQRATNIPTSLFEVLAADDDDGDLTNGTPNECAIRGAFGQHGMRTATGHIVAPGFSSTNAQSTIVRVELEDLADRCGASDEIDFVTLIWKPSFTQMPTAGSKNMTRVTRESYYADLPLAIDAPVYYSAKVQFLDGSVLTLADNLADPYYTLYQGTTVALYCTDFERDPFAEGWTKQGEGLSAWSWGDAVGAATDPAAAYSGTKILAQSLGGEYAPDSTGSVTLPEIDVGHWSDVRLQYRRWLAVEDSEFDKARVTVNGRQAWVNFTAAAGNNSSTHHIDREWRFHDVGLSGYSVSSKLNVGFDLTSDAGLQLGGWAIDDLCVVANVNSICGDGVKTITEGCDLGEANSDEPDAECRTFCRPASCGDEIVDSVEECDHGPDGDDVCTSACVLVNTDSGCCSSNTSPAGAGVLSFLAGLAMLRRRRQR